MEKKLSRRELMGEGAKKIGPLLAVAVAQCEQNPNIPQPSRNPASQTPNPAKKQ